MPYKQIIFVWCSLVLKIVLCVSQNVAYAATKLMIMNATVNIVCNSILITLSQFWLLLFRTVACIFSML